MTQTARAAQTVRRLMRGTLTQRLSAALLVVTMVSAACSEESAPHVTPAAPTGGARVQSSATTLTLATQPTHVVRWIAVEYRPTAVDVGHPRFQHLNGAGSSLIREA